MKQNTWYSRNVERRHAYYLATRKLIPKEQQEPHGNHRLMLSGLTKQILKEMYEAKQMSQWKIAAKFGVTQGAVMYWMRKWDIPARTKKDGIMISRMRDAFSGPNNPTWRGGRHINPGGYVAVRDPKHPRAQKRGYVLEHIKVWMETHGREVPQGWQVHHINGNKKDNRPENLVALSDKKHRRVIPLLQQRIRKLEKLLFEKERGDSTKSK